MSGPIEKCRAGDEHACVDAIGTEAGDELLAHEVRICQSGAAERCARAASWQLQHWGYPVAGVGALLERGCVEGHAPSCAGWVDLILEDHHGVWDCAHRHDLLVDDQGDAPVVPMTLTAAGSTTPIELEIDAVGPELASLRACLVDAFAHTRFPSLPAAHVTSFELPISFFRSWPEKHRQTDLAVSFEPDDSLASCPAGAFLSCRVMPRRSFQLVYMPTPDRVDLFETLPTSPYTLELLIQFCVDLEGHTRNVEVLDDAGAPQVGELWQRVMQKWRSKPARVDGQPVPACTRVRLELDSTWRSDLPLRPSWRPRIEY